MTGSQRRFERKSIRATFRASQGDGSGTLTFESSDVSEGGAFLKSDLLLEEGEVLTLELSLPGTKTVHKAEGKIVWSKRFPREGEDGGMGVQFTDLPDAARAALVAFLEQQG